MYLASKNGGVGLPYLENGQNEAYFLGGREIVPDSRIKIHIADDTRFANTSMPEMVQRGVGFCPVSTQAAQNLRVRSFETATTEQLSAYNGSLQFAPQLSDAQLAGLASSLFKSKIEFAYSSETQGGINFRELAIMMQNRSKDAFLGDSGDDGEGTVRMKTVGVIINAVNSKLARMAGTRNTLSGFWNIENSRAPTGLAEIKNYGKIRESPVRIEDVKTLHMELRIPKDAEAKKRKIMGVKPADKKIGRERAGARKVSGLEETAGKRDGSATIKTGKETRAMETIKKSKPKEIKHYDSTVKTDKKERAGSLGFGPRTYGLRVRRSGQAELRARLMKDSSKLPKIFRSELNNILRERNKKSFGSLDSLVGAQVCTIAGEELRKPPGRRKAMLEKNADACNSGKAGTGTVRRVNFSLEMAKTIKTVDIAKIAKKEKKKKKRKTLSEKEKLLWILAKTCKKKAPNKGIVGIWN